MPVGRSLAVTIGVLLALAFVGIGLALLANGRLTHNRNLLLNQVGPARRAALSLETALVNEETGVRGYVITDNPSSLQPYGIGQAEEAKAYAELRAQEHVIGPRLATELATLSARTRAWQDEFVVPALANPRLTARRAVGTGLEGKQQFDAVRVSLASLRDVLELRDAQARNALQSAANALQLILILAGALILGSVLLAGLFLRHLITRPLARLGSEAGRVAAGEFTRPLAIATGPREITELGIEIDAMRERIVQELSSVQAASAKLASQSEELRRSNAELEQFAYVASHDLQEPLRKVASFCQALRSRYHGQLDERADQYIDFAADGARRMQTLIDALLALSRVGHGEEPHERLALDEIASAAASSLTAEIRAAGAQVLIDPLPEVRGERTLLVSVFQNLIGNAIKFHSAEAPVIRIGAERREQEWLLSFADNGIGIERQYDERIFQIFQRLHTRDAYEGTGIGLALCRKIAEYHGGRIWLDPDYTGGARFQLTLPLAELPIAKER
jgi:signal transduction histidine kinase